MKRSKCILKNLKALKRSALRNTLFHIDSNDILKSSKSPTKQANSSSTNVPTYKLRGHYISCDANNIASGLYEVLNLKIKNLPSRAFKQA